MSTKELYEQEMYFIEQAEPDGFREPYRIRQHVTALEEELAAKDAEIARLAEQVKGIKAVADMRGEACNNYVAEIAELKRQRDDYKAGADAEAWCGDMDRRDARRRFERYRRFIRKLQAELATVRAERDNWKSLHEIKNDLLAKLVTRIEAAPKVWLWWEKTFDDSEYLRGAREVKDGQFPWNRSTFSECDRFEQVHAVPVIDANHPENPESWNDIVEANKKDKKALAEALETSFRRLTRLHNEEPHE